MMRKFSRFSKLGRSLCFIILTLMLLPLLLSATVPQAAADPGWWDANWNYRTPVTLNTHENVPENYQYKIVLDKVDNLNSHCLDNFQDVRFLDNEDSGVLSFWIENYISGDNAVFWVRREDNSLADNTIYVYHGNASAESAENITATFILGDDFAGTTIDSSKWTEVDANNYITQNENLIISGGPSGYTHAIYSADNIARPFIFESKWKADNYYYSGQGIKDATAGIDYTDFVYLLQSYATNAQYYYWHDGTGAPAGGIGSYSIDTQYWMRFVVLDNGCMVYQSENNIDWVLVKDDSSYSTESPLKVGWHLYEQGFEVDDVKVRKYVSPEPTASVGSEESAGNLIISSVTADNSLVDRKHDISWTTPVLGTTITVDVETTVVGENADNIADNARIMIKDAGGNAVVSNQTTTNISIVDENTKRFVFPAYNPDDALADDNLGAFSVFVEAWSTTSYDNDTNSSAFMVDDLDNSVVPSQENLPGHRHRIYGTAARETGGSVTLTGGRRIDNNDGTVVATVSGTDFENTWAPSATGSVYFELETAELDGRTDNLDYNFPNIAPEVISVSVDNSVIDRDVDYAGSGADTDTTITVRLRDNDNRSDFADAWIAVRDVLDALIDNKNIFSTATTVDENQIDVTMTYDATDNTLANNQLGAWDVWTYALDVCGGVGSGWQTSKFTVDDLTSTINFDPAVPYIGWDLTVSGTHSRVSGGAISIDASWLIDNKHGQFALGASNTYDNTYTISNATLDENISVTLRTLDAPLDGSSVSSYKTNENVKFEVWVRFEENYGVVGWIPDENRPLDLLFEWDGGTYPYTLTGNPENITVTAGGIATKIVKITDNDAYWRYIIPALPGGSLTFVIVDDPTEVEQYRFFLQDYTGLYTPPDGQLLIKSWIGTDLAGINDDFWGADWRTTAWLVTGVQYQIWVRGADAPLRLVGPIDAVVPSEEKTIIVQVVISELDPIFDYVYWVAWRESDTIIRVEYRDNLDNTIEAHVGIYDMDGNLMSQYQPDNEWFIVTWPDAENTKSYEAVLTVQHGIYGDFTRNVPIGLMEGPPGVPGGVSTLFGLPAGVTLAALGSVILMFIMGLSFDALRVQLGVLAMALTTLFCWYMGFLPLPGPYDGAFTATLILVAAVLFALTWRRGK